ncbi:hypothetical protein [Neotamlana nanhaiensis]|uniref:hypothetical protein n=1 Tax=Neotamlana nanhaiensis TaxID=1382798 RepID=UPI00069A0FA3|nr:hypothetical protein [Tamlana nanhaiensis]
MALPEILSYAVNLLELIAAIVALVNYKKYAQSTERYFLHFLWFTVFVDTFIGLFILSFYEINRTLVYYIYTGFSFCFYFWWYYRVLQKKWHKSISIVLGAIFLCVFLLGFQTNGSQKFIFIIGAFFVLILTGFHLLQLSNSSYTLKIKHKLSFWISTALVLFNIGMFPLILMSDYFKVRMDNLVFTNILFLLNLVLYTCYIIGFIWTKKKYNHF